MSGVHAVDARAEAGDHGDQLHDGPLKVGEAIPAVCTVADMCRIFRMARPTFYRRRPEFAKFLLNGSTHVYSGYRVAKHLTGGSFAITVRRS